MKILNITSWQILVSVILWSLVFAVLSMYSNNSFQLLNIVGFLFLLIVPGSLTVMILKLKKLNFWGYAGLIVGFSLLELIIIVLLGNTLLPLFNISRPLDKASLLFEIFLLTYILGVVFLTRFKNIKVSLKRYLLFDDFRSLVIAMLPIIFVVFSIFGAIRLNNGASNIVTMIMLGGMGVYIIVLYKYSDKENENIIPTALYFMSLALLLMTSLRGWHVTGHDIQSEYNVFQLAKNSGVWSMSSFRDAYNACMSITILPTIFYNTLKISEPYVFKVLFQIIFAFSPVLVYLIGRKWTNKKISFLATIYFIGFPTFFYDMPFLIRQEVAFLFYGLMLYVLFATDLRLNTRRYLFMAMSVGVVLSHYSTTYTVILIIGLTVVFRSLFVKIINYFRLSSLLKNSALISSLGRVGNTKQRTSYGMLLVLILLSFFWTSIITDTGGGLSRVIIETASVVKNGFSGSDRSIDVGILLSFTRPDQKQGFQDYKENIVKPINSGDFAYKYYNDEQYNKYPFEVMNEEVLPLSKLGMFLGKSGLDIKNAVAILGQLIIKLLELLMPLGMIYLFFRNKIVKKVNYELFLISFFCLVFIALNVTLPVLSTEYGIFRAMQQAMLVMAPMIVIGSILLGNIFGKNSSDGKPRYKFAVFMAVLFFLYSSSFLRQLVGGNSAMLHLNNDGAYYFNYLIKTSEIYGTEWLNTIAKADYNEVNGTRLVIRTDNISNKKTASLAYLQPYNDIYPGLIRRDAYVLLNSTVILKKKATVIYKADQITYGYSVQFLDEVKNLVYNNGEARIYQ